MNHAGSLTPNTPGEQRPTETEPRWGVEPVLWAAPLRCWQGTSGHGTPALLLHSGGIRLSLVKNSERQDLECSGRAGILPAVHCLCWNMVNLTRVDGDGRFSFD